MKCIKYKNKNNLYKKVAELISSGKIVAWFQGGSEFGARALGHRSILADPRNSNIKEIINKNIKFRECYDGFTQVLTSEGWKYFKDVKNDEIVATLNPNTNELIYQKIDNKIEKHYDGEMISFKNDRINLFVTANHNMWVRKRNSNHFEFEKAKNITQRHTQLKAIEKWNGIEKEYFILPEVIKYKNIAVKEKKINMDNWLEFLGYYLSEGCFCYDNGHYNVYISQKKHYKIFENCIYGLNEEFNWNYKENTISFKCANKQLFEYVKQFGKAEDKFIPREFLNLSERQLKILFDALMLGDGHKRKHKNCTSFKYVTVSKKLAENIEEIGLKLGYSIITTQEKVENRLKKYIVRLNSNSKTSYVREQHIEKMHYNGMVYCVNVPKHHILCVKREDKISFSGNCWRPYAPIVMEELVNEYFDIEIPSKYMMFSAMVKDEYRKQLVGITHVDGTARYQTVCEKNDSIYYLLKEFYNLTNIGVLLNTSFNIDGEPIIETPQEAINSFMKSKMDCLVIENYFLEK